MRIWFITDDITAGALRKQEQRFRWLWLVQEKPALLRAGFDAWCGVTLSTDFTDETET